MKKYFLLLISTAFINCLLTAQVLRTDDYKHYIDGFNTTDNELYKLGEFPNEKAWEFLSQNIPLFDCPDKQLEETYYFRWWTYRKHIRKTPDGYVITEFLPCVGWAGKNNSISCAAAHHFMEGRWLKETKFYEDYARFWLKGGGSPRQYTFWISDALANYTYVHPNDSLLKELFPLLENNYAAWERERLDSTGLFWQFDGQDGMEVSISGAYPGCQSKGYRATINSAMYAEVTALENMAVKFGFSDKAKFYENKAIVIRNNINKRLWDTNAQFFKVIPYGGNMSFTNVREQHGFTPWYFNIPPDEYSVAWKFLMDSKYFYAPYGPTTAEQCHPEYKIAYEGHECQWNGPSWPYSTSVTLTALANLLNNYSQTCISNADYFKLLINYSRSHSIILEDGTKHSWIDENLNPVTGDWIARTRLKTWQNGTWSNEKGGVERGKDYNHSTFNDLIITGLIGIRPSSGNALTINPLIPSGTWDYFCLDKLYYKGKTLTIYYDKTGKHYGNKKGYFVLVDGKTAFNAPEPQSITINL